MSKAIRHGEIMLVPVDKVPDGLQVKRVSSYIVGHSKTGHNHVLEQTDFEVLEDANNDVFFRLFAPGKLVHKKATDRHRDLVVPAGIYQRFHDTEYNPFEKVIQDVAD